MLVAMTRTAEASGSGSACGAEQAGTPWSVRTTTRRDGRPVLEIYEHGELLDVVIASALSCPLTGTLLRGARRYAGDGHSAGLAWGRLAADRSLPVVAFHTGGLRPLWRPVRPAVVAREFWLARTFDRTAGVLLRHADGSTERLRPLHAHPMG